MNIQKICEALNETDELGNNIFTNCAVAQLFHTSGKTIEGIRVEREQFIHYADFFDKLLKREYGMSNDDSNTMFMLNDENIKWKESKSARHQRVLEHYENLLIESLVEECVVVEESSQPVEQLV